MAIIDKEITTIKHIVFGKIKTDTRDANHKKLEKLQKQKNEAVKNTSDLNKMNAIALID